MEKKLNKMKETEKKERKIYRLCVLYKWYIFWFFYVESKIDR